MGKTLILVAILVGGLALMAVLLMWVGKEPAPKPAPAKDKEKGAKPGKTPPAGADAETKAKPPAAAEPTGRPSHPERLAPSRAQTVPEPAVQRRSVPSAMLPEQLHEEDEDDDITIVTLAPRLDLQAEAGLPDARDADDDDDDAIADSNRATAVPIIYDEDAAEDEPTRAHAVILVGAVGQTDRGQKRKINEDRYLVLDDHNLYVVADGMGGHAGGEVASQLAVDTIAAAFTEGRFEGQPYEDVPRRGSELALAIQMANRAIHEKSKRELKLAGMGTTIVSARFTPGKERVYIGHVGDSRCYRFRAGQLTQVTTDHTMGAVGMTGPFADHLSRAVGIAPAVKVDLVIAKPRHDDVFLLCSDGLSKMVKDDAIREILAAHDDPNDAAKALVQRANEKGGRDNITVILVVVKDPRGFARYAQERKRKDAAAAEAAAKAEGAKVEGAKAEGAKADPEIVVGDPVSIDTPAVSDPRAALPEGVPVLVDVKATAPDVAATAADVRASAPEVAAGDARTTAPEGTAIPVVAKAVVPDARTTAPEGTPIVTDVAAKKSVPPPRPSTPPRASVPPRPSTPEARKSSPETRPSVPEARKNKA